MNTDIIRVLYYTDTIHVLYYTDIIHVLYYTDIIHVLLSYDEEHNLTYLKPGLALLQVSSSIAAPDKKKHAEPEVAMAGYGLPVSPWSMILEHAKSKYLGFVSSCMMSL